MPYMIDNLSIRFWTMVGFVGFFGCIALFIGCKSASRQTTDSMATTVAKSSDRSDRLEFNGKGELIRPHSAIYREWVFVGSPVTPNDMNDGQAALPGFHNIYMHPEDYRYFMTNGEYQNGTMFVSELVDIGSNKAASGKGYFQGELQDS